MTNPAPAEKTPEAPVSEPLFAQAAQCRWCQASVGGQHREDCPARGIKVEK